MVDCGAKVRVEGFGVDLKVGLGVAAVLGVRVGSELRVGSNHNRKHN